MPLTNPWDETFPPDTQLANLLGNDIRQFKSDIRERVAQFAVGLFANMPTPDAMFGAAGIGVMYYAYDACNLYYWNGAAWVGIHTNFQGFDSNAVAVAAGPLTQASVIQLHPLALIPGGEVNIIAAFHSATTPSAGNTMGLYVQSAVPAFTVTWNDAAAVVITAKGVLAGTIPAVTMTTIFQGFVTPDAGGATVVTEQVIDNISIDQSTACLVQAQVQLTAGTGNPRGLSGRIDKGFF